MSSRGFGLTDLDWKRSYRRPDGTARDKPPSPVPESAADEERNGEKARECIRLITGRLWWIVIALGAAGILNTWAVMLGRGTHAHISAVLHVILLVGLPAFVISLVLMCAGREKYPRLFLVGYMANLVSLVIFLMLFSACIGLVMAASETKRAIAYCESLIPRLELHRQQTGMYPDTIEAIASREHEPPLLRGRRFYIPQGDGYVLEFPRPQKKWEMMEYASWEGRWKKVR